MNANDLFKAERRLRVQNDERTFGRAGTWGGGGSAFALRALLERGRWREGMGLFLRALFLT